MPPLLPPAFELPAEAAVALALLPPPAPVDELLAVLPPRTRAMVTLMPRLPLSAKSWAVLESKTRQSEMEMAA